MRHGDDSSGDLEDLLRVRQEKNPSQGRPEGPSEEDQCKGQQSCDECGREKSEEKGDKKTVA